MLRLSRFLKIEKRHDLKRMKGNWWKSWYI